MDNSTNIIHEKDDNTWLPLNESFSTLAIHAGYSSKSSGYSSVIPPISLSTTYELDAPAINRGYEYSRTGNPSRQVLEQRLAALEGGKHVYISVSKGEIGNARRQLLFNTVCFSSGLSAISALLSLLKSGDHIICSDDIYGGASRLMSESVTRNNLQVEFVDLTEICNLKSALKKNTRMVFLESPANPTLKVFDILKISESSHKYSKDILVAVDNTVLTSFFQRPLELGVDLVHYSLTKYANGHADALMGAVITNQDILHEKLCYFQNAFGSVPSPFECYLVTRGLKTLHLRMPALMLNSTKVAKYLESHSKVEKVFHPGLKSHPQHQLAMQQSSGHSSLLSFRIKEECGSAVKFIGNLNIFQNAASFGGCESLAELPAYFTHIMVPEAQRKKLGITNNFVRLAVGLESAKDLIQDISQALDNC